ncbi:succinylglutamate desuccinylase/aspartoacylase family protein [Tenacibaculum sp. AHE15PA]|uniref:succinylglutamate desuccinylase/aspartoacylase family protein n=1 Tax=unclassified Tenacibaculum TaxID=2635139 RepID=UPI001C4FF413|nr:succinylglutamate desuccinylase/aspartoacylase family protein [Tenacibaculum sp. AHE14PA]QXP77314.1 succinylglutamate desuccinylase/aspartoacylase family protein [Tenacibaculum sp. AHE15PA]
MINKDVNTPESSKSIHLYKRKWIRATVAGLFNCTVKNGSNIKKGQILGHIMGTYGEINFTVKAPTNGYIIVKNNFPIINMGDALLHTGRT